MQYGQTHAPEQNLDMEAFVVNMKGAVRTRIYLYTELSLQRVQLVCATF